MKKKTKSDEFIKLFHYWCGRFKIEKPIEARQDNRMDCTAAIDNWWDNKICLRFHSRKIGQLKQFEIINDIFHEIGHVIHNLPYDTEEQMINAEYEAEKFATIKMKTYYPKEYKQLLKYMRDKRTMNKLKKKKSLYYKAFSRIKDYKDTEI